MFAPVNPKSAVKGTWGNIKVSRSELVARKIGRRGMGGFFPEPTIPLALTQNLPKNVSDALLAVERKNLPHNITKWIDAAGLQQDWQANCETVVFCSFVQINSERARGFVIEEREVAELAGKRFLESPFKTIFINHYISLEDREMLMGHEFFPHLAYLLGQLKSKTDFSAAGIDPDSTRYEMRSFYAALYELQAISKLMCALIKEEGKKPAIVRADAGGRWIAPAEERLRGSYSLLNDSEKLALYSRSVIPSPLPFGIKLPV